MKLAVISSPFGSHIGRMEFIFRTLRDRGHDVEFWGSGATKTIAKRNGFKFRELPLGSDYVKTMQRKLKAHEFYTEVFFPMAKEQVATVLEYCDKYTPDLLEANARLYSAVVASKLTGIPLINHNPNGFSFNQIPEDLYGFCAKGNESARQKSVSMNLSADFFAQTDQWFNTNISQPFGLGTIANTIGFASSTHVVAHTIADLSKPRIASLPNVFLTGPIMSEISTGIDFSEFKPYCYLSLGTCPWSKTEVLNRYRILAQHIPRDYKIVIGLGELLSSEELGIDDDRVKVFEQAPQLEAIKHCEFVVCHGGCQSVHEALYFGKPLIGIPYHAELSEMVNSVEINNAGIRISPAQLNQKTIVDAVARIASSEVRHNAGRLSEKLQQLDAEKRISELFETAGRH